MRDRPLAATRRLVYEHDLLEVYDDDLTMEDGTTRRSLRLVEGTGAPGVAVVCTDGAHVLLVRQYRYAIGADAWELPRGYGESADPAEDAARELHEETGIAADSLTRLGTLHPNTGLLATEIVVFAAVVHSRALPTVSNDEVEEARWFDAEELEEAVRTGLVTDAITLGALLQAHVGGVLPESATLGDGR